ncbi:unnamed protein product [Notodromas monacha]|uniref:Thiamine transporter 1 n=1 Tax=Notodromas monacha TaxID=399045 RepID=A0A7R9BVV5_9CRUS|nr:unnamed protein product [Notodromas monacha]CAG0922751.1 unnamed protein product [Notodromas monacha]
MKSVFTCGVNVDVPKQDFTSKSKAAFGLLWADAKFAFSKSDILKWSIWWAFGTCGNFQVGNYIQPLWEEIAPVADNEIYNGGVEAVTTLLGAVAAFSVAYVDFDWNLVGDLVLCIISLIDAATLVLMALTDDIWVAYVSYVVFRMSYQTMITIISYQVAKEIRPDSYGLIFGVNTFCALLLQTILTMVVVEPFGLGLGPRKQFVVYGGYFGSLGILFLGFAVYVLCFKKPVTKKESWEQESVPREEPPVGLTESF